MSRVSAPTAAAAPQIQREDGQLRNLEKWASEDENGDRRWDPGMRACFELASTIEVQAASEEMAGQTTLETPDFFLMEDEQQTPSGPLSVTPPVPAWFLTAVAWDLTGVVTGIVTSRRVSPAMGDGSSQTIGQPRQQRRPRR
jgi:hypothetical protein